MKNNFSKIIFFVLFLPNVKLTPKKVAKPITKKLSYVAETDKIQLILSGSVYETAGKKCLIRKEATTINGFTEINTCVKNVGTHSDNKCVRPCVGNDNELTFNVLSPRTKYIYVYAGDNAEAIKAKVTGGDVFGLSIPVLVNPIITITTDNQKKLKLEAKTCPKVNCPITYKGIQYKAGTAGNNCEAANLANAVDFDPMIPHYEMKCVKYPSFFYKMPNFYMRQNIDIYKPQYYVTNKTGDSIKTSYLLKFTNPFPNEICLFSIKDGVDSPDGETATYASSCGGEVGKKCYTPCNNVELKLKQTKPIVKILIQTRHHLLEENKGKFDGYEEIKFAITEVANTYTVLTTPIATGVTLDRSLFNPDTSGATKFSTCTIKYFPADKLRPADGSGMTTQCLKDSTVNNCDNTCSASSVISGLSAGKSYIIEMAPQSLAKYNGYKEYLFFKTAHSSSFVDKPPTPTDASASLKVIDGAMATEKTETTCSYYLSEHGKNAFEEAECEDSTPCRGFCKETKKLINLMPKTSYDIKVVSNKDYATKSYENILTTLSSLSLKHKFLDKGFQVIGTLTTAYPKALCHYKIKIKNGQDFQEIMTCPVVNPAVSKIELKTPSPTKLQSSIFSENHNAKKFNSSSLTNISKFQVARSANGDGGTKTSTKANPKTLSVTKIPPCGTVPLCNSIVISEGYEANKEYQILVKAVDRSEEVTISIPTNMPLEKAKQAENQITFDIVRDGENLRISSFLPKGKDDSSKCKWILRNMGDPSYYIVKKCVEEGDNGCTIPLCKTFTIEGVSVTIDYHLTVILADDPNIYGVDQIKEGEYSNRSRANSSMIIGIVVPIVIIVICMGFYFGYWKNKE